MDWLDTSLDSFLLFLFLFLFGGFFFLSCLFFLLLLLLLFSESETRFVSIINLHLTHVDIRVIFNF